MGRAAAGSRAVLERLAGAGLELHLQVVLCPGWNDGDVLAETVLRAGALVAATDLGVVPVSLAEEGDLRRVTRADARALLAAVQEWQRGFLERRGDAFVHAADEFYLLAGEEPPAGAPEQYENGVGISAALLAETDALAAGWTGGRGHGEAPRRPRRGVSGVRLLTGTLAAPVLARAAAVLAPAAGVPVRTFVVENGLFGAHVTVTGLLGGREVLEALRRDPLADGEWLLAPRVWLPGDLGRTLDDVAERDLAAACGGRLIVADALGDAFARLSG
jgi:NifB/MoaA-like Fe-S oxidoreductase